jgi:transposase InsO family protein
VLCYDFTYGQEMGLPEFRQLIVLPGSKRRGAIERAHQAVAHKALEATVAELHKTVYFSGMYRWVNETLRRCETCQVKKRSVPNQRGLLVSHVTGYPFQKINIDFVGPLPRSSKGNYYMLTVSDCFTRWLEAFPCPRANVQVVVNKLVNEIFPWFGVCDQIHSDRGTQFPSDLVTKVIAMLGIRQSATPSYNQKSYPVERKHRSLGDAIKNLTEGDQHAWEDCLPHALFAMRTSICVSTGVVPFAAMIRRNASASLEMVFGAPPTLPNDVADMYEYTTSLRYRIAKAHAYVHKNMRGALDRQRKAYYKDRKSFLPTQPVWLWTPRLRPGQSRNFALYWTGPWQIKKQLNKLMYEITPHHSWARQGSEAVSIDRLKPFHAIYVGALKYHCPPSPKDDLKMLGNEFAEFVDDNLEDEIDAGPPAAQQLPAGAQQAPPLPAAAAAAAAADPPPFGQLEHAAHPVPPAVFNDEEDAAHAPQMRLGQRPYGQRQRQRRMDAEAANGLYWLPGQPLPPAPLVRDAIPAEKLRGQRRGKYQRQRAREEEQLEVHDQRANRRDRAAPRNAREIPITKQP